MTYVPSFKSRILAGDYSLSAKVTSVDPTITVDMLETTTLVDQDKVFINGLQTSVFNLQGYLDPDATADLQFDQLTDYLAASSAEPITYGPSGLALGSEVILVNAIASQFQPGNTTTTPVSFSLATQTDGRTDYGVSLHDLLAVTADESGTGYDGTAQSTTGGVAHLHVTAFSGFSGAAVIVEDSANNSTWATIGTFTTAAGLTSQRLAIAGTIRRYTRYSVDVTGSGSITFQVGLARR